MSEKSYLLVEGIVLDAGTDTDMVNLANALGLEDYEITEAEAVDLEKAGVYIQFGEVIYPNTEAQEKLNRIFS